MRKIYIVGKSFRNYANWMQGELVNKIEDADLVVFGGGEDVDPSLYSEKKNNRTFSNLERDIVESRVFARAKELNKPCLGICRGSQFLCVMSGGRLVQHQDNPHFLHKMITIDDKEIIVSSTHHQAQYPYDMKDDSYKLLGWTNGISNTHQDGLGVEINSDKNFKEAEIVYYPKTKSLGIQPHPEMIYGNKGLEKSIEYFQDLLNKFLKDEL